MQLRLPSTRHDVFRLIGTALLSGAAALVLLYFLWPTTLIDGAMRLRRMSAGLTRQVAFVPQGAVPFLRSGPSADSGKRVIVLLHGFEQDKDAWINLARELRGDHVLIIPDLFGFGENFSRVHTDYRPETQARRLRTLLKAISIRKVDLVGWSMGGEIAASFAAQFPEMVSSLALISAAGVRSDTTTALDRRLLSGDNIFHVTDAASLDRMLSLLNDSGTVMPKLMKRAVVLNSRRRMAQWDTVFQQLSTEPVLYQLDSIAPTIATRTLVLWGAKDPLYHPSAARRLAARLPHADLRILPDCGHICPVSRPKEVAAHYLTFLGLRAAALADIPR